MPIIKDSHGEKEISEHTYFLMLLNHICFRRSKSEKHRIRVVAHKILRRSGYDMAENYLWRMERDHVNKDVKK